ncbi:MAG: hypothetical protein Q8L48_31790 [Archangium sp.]|nr:hypothetical protein [Archangium sp.]
MKRCLPLLVAAGLVSCTQPIPRKVESGFSMADHSLPFANFAGGYLASAMDAELMQRMYGDAVCKDASSPCELTLAAQNFVNKANRAMNGGRCEGFAVAASLMQAGRIVATDFGGTTARDLELDDNVELQRELAYWFSTQLHPQVSQTTKGYMAKDVMPRLAEVLRADASERVRIGIVKKQGGRVTGGHAVTPIAYYADPANEGVYLVRVYDNNLPDAERTMKIDTKNNRWEYEAAENPGKRSSLYYGDDSNKNPLYLAPIFTRTGQLPCYFCDGKTTQVTTHGGAQVSLADGAGVVDGEVTSNENTSVIPGFSAQNDTDGASFIINTNTPEVSLEIRPGDDGTSTDTNDAEVEVQGDTFGHALRGLTLLGLDQFAVTQGGRAANFANGSRTDLTLESSALVNGRPVNVRTSIAGGSDNVGSSVDEMGVVVIDTRGSMGAQVVVTVTTQMADGGTASGTLAYTSEGDSSVGANSGQLAMSGTLDGTLNNNGTMQPLSNACEDGRVSGMESDVDCGGTCMTKCADGNTCNAGADCASTFCNTTTSTCVATQCADAIKATDESDVDCGGTSTCARCGVGQACTGSLDCASGLTCEANQCKASFLLSVNVVGLPALGTLTVTNATSGEALTFTSAGAQTWPSRTTGPYSVSITAQPFNGTCTLMNGTGTATADVTLQVTCTPLFSIGGTVAGLAAGQSVTLLNNGGDAVSVSADGAFAFPTRIAGAYAVTIQTQPGGQSCTLANETGTASGDVTTVQVSCTSGFTLGGTLTGLGATEQVILQNGGDFLPLFADGPFTFPTPAAGAYSVSVNSSPMGKLCFVLNGSGTATANVTNVVVTCTTSGTLDTTFATSGAFISSQSAGSDLLTCGVTNVDNTLVVAGQSAVTGTDNDMVVAKLNYNGTLDGTFGTSGVVTISNGVALESARAVLKDGTGYLVVGTLRGTTSGNPDVGIARLDAAGALDTAFGTNGITTHDNGQWEYVEGVTRDSLGRIIAVGRLSPAGAGPHDIFVVRMNSDGSLDGTFGTSGWTLWNGGGDEGAQSVAIDTSSSDIVVLGSNGTDTLVLKLLASTGGLWTSFGTGGVATIDLSGASRPEQPRRVQVLATDLYVVGRVDGPVDSDLALVKLDVAGGLDPTFGTGGRLLIDRGAAETGYALTPSPSGGWYVGGQSGNALLVARVTPGGTIDTTFAANGFFQSTFSSAGLAYALLTDVTDKVVAIGTVGASGSEDLAVARINP